jgi:hypothetical protein
VADDGWLLDARDAFFDARRISQPKPQASRVLGGRSR